MVTSPRLSRFAAYHVPALRNPACCLSPGRNGVQSSSGYEYASPDDMAWGNPGCWSSETFGRAFLLSVPSC